MTLGYTGAGDGQCLGVKADGDRCTNGVYGNDLCCGTHKNASDVTLAPETDDRVWYDCPECGWQPAEYAGPGTAPMCADCGVEFPPGNQWEDQSHGLATDGGVDRQDCPEAFCPSIFRPEEMVAHLQMDHGYTQHKAEIIVQREFDVTLRDGRVVGQNDYREHYLMLAKRWGDHAERNIEKWGNQDPKGLLLAMAEELAEIADELLEDNGLPPNAYRNDADRILNDIRTDGYRAREFLEEQCEDEDGNPLPMDERPDLDGVAQPERASDEVEDLAPLVYQLYWALENRSVSTASPQGVDDNE